MSAPDDPLTLEIRRDLERVDQVMTRVILDPTVAEEFVRDPNGVLSRLGLHPRTTPEINSRANRIFYAVLTNTELMGTVLDHYSTFVAPSGAAAVLNDALERGEIENSMELDLAAAEHAFGDEDFLRRVYHLTLHDLNRRGLLQNRYATEEIDAYVDRMVGGIRGRRSLGDEEPLEAWDERYGVDKGYGTGRRNEVGVLVTAVVPVQVVAPATLVVPVVILGVEEEVVARALRGDPRAARAVATVGAVLRFAGEVLVHADNFERS